MKILLGSDGSDHSRVAEMLVAKAPLWRASEVEVISACPPPMIVANVGLPTESLYGAEVDRVWAQAREETHQKADAAAKRLGEAGVRATAHVRDGDAAEALLDRIEEGGIDLVAVGSRGQNAFASFLLGSVARKLVSHSPVSVLVGRAPKPLDELTDLGSKPKIKVAVAVDGTEGSRVAMDALVAQGAGAFSQVVAITVEPLVPIPLGLDPIFYVETFPSERHAAQEVAEAAHAKLAACADEVVAERVIGHPAAEILKAAAKHEVDLLVMGATRHAGWERFLIGSVSYEVATSAGCSVLIVRPPSEA